MAPTPAGIPAMAKQPTPKTMSSRLMTMKFMQRGAAAAASAEASGNSSPVPPRSDDGSTKRRKTSHTPVAGPAPAAPLYDQKAIQSALEEEEKKRQAAIEKRAAELGDSHWVLKGVPAPKTSSRPLLNVVQVGFAQIDHASTSGGSEDPFTEGDSAASAKFKRFNINKSKAQKIGQEEDDSSDSDSSSDSEDAENENLPVSARDEPGRGRRTAASDLERKRSRSSVSGRREEERRKAQQLAGKRRKKDVKLNQLTSISSAGSQAFQRPSPGLSCHGCGKPGHKVADCPSKKR